MIFFKRLFFELSSWRDQTISSIAQWAPLTFRLEPTLISSWSQIVLVLYSRLTPQNGFCFFLYFYPDALQKRTGDALRNLIECNKIKKRVLKEIRLKEKKKYRRNSSESRYACCYILETGSRGPRFCSELSCSYRTHESVCGSNVLSFLVLKLLISSSLDKFCILINLV